MVKRKFVEPDPENAGEDASSEASTPKKKGAAKKGPKASRGGKQAGRNGGSRKATNGKKSSGNGSKATGSKAAGSKAAGVAEPEPAEEAEATAAEETATEPAEAIEAGEAAAAADSEANGEGDSEATGEAEAADKPTESKPRRRRRKKDPKELLEFKPVVEGLLFSTREPVGANRLASVIRDLTVAEVRELLEKLSTEYRRQKRGFTIEEVGGGFRIVTVPELAEKVRKLHRIRTEDRLTPAALETLSIIAYRQPIIRADIEVIRGVQCGGTLKWLMEKGLVKITGRADVLGRPLLYGTSQDFLEQFGLNTIEDLPRVDEFRSKTD